MEREFFKDFKLIIKQIILNFKYILSNGKMLFLLVIFFIVVMFTTIVFVPFKYGISLSFFLAAIAPASLIYISTSFAGRSGTLYKNMLTTKNRKSFFYLASAICMLITVYILSMILLVSMAILNNFGFLISGGREGHQMKPYTIFNLFGLPFLYCLFEMSLVMFAMLFFAQNVIRTEKGMYLFVVVILVLVIIYGGIFNTYFSNYLVLSVDPDTGERVLVSRYKPELFPDFLFGPTAVLFPLFAPTQHITAIKGYLDMAPTDTYKFFNGIPTDSTMLEGLDNAMQISVRGNILGFLPYIHTTILASSSLLIGKYRDN